MPFTPVSVAVLVCEKILTEKDDVITAIRIVDVFSVPENPHPEMRVIVHVLISLKSRPSDETYHLSLEHHHPDGSVVVIGTPSSEFRVPPSPLGPAVPTGVNVQLEALIDPLALGMHFIRALVDDTEVGRVEFTLLRRGRVA